MFQDKKEAALKTIEKKHAKVEEMNGARDARAVMEWRVAMVACFGRWGPEH